MRYLAFCIAGFEKIAVEAVSHALNSNLRTYHIEDGFLVFNCNAAAGRVGAVPYLNNSFTVLNSLNDINKQNIEKVACALLQQNTLKRLSSSILPHEHTFRLMINDKGQLVSIQKNVRNSLIKAIGRSTGLRYTPNRANVEFWVIRRRSNIAFLAKRIGSRAKTERDLKKGELPPELAHLLCFLSDIRDTDIFLDPFSGTGAIPLTRATLPYNMIYACDVSEEQVVQLKETVKSTLNRKNRKRSPFIVHQADARTLTKFDNGFVDKVVTDPPWGIYDNKNIYSIDFYMATLKELVRITKLGGVIVLLIGREDISIQLRDAFQDELECCLFINILVAGRKAIVVKWRRLGKQLNE